MLRYLFFVVSVLITLPFNAQNDRYFDDIKKTFDEKSRAELDKAKNALKKGEVLFAEGEKLFSSGKISKALSKSESASSVFADNYRKMFVLYDTKLKDAVSEVSGDKKSYLEYLMQNAENSFRESIYLRLKSGKEKKNDSAAYMLLKSAHEKEVEAVDIQSRVFALLNGREEADYKVSETVYSPVSVPANRRTLNYDAKSFSVNDPDLKNRVNFKRNVFVSADGNKGETGSFDESSESKTYAVYGEDNNFSEREFRLQIGASVLPANESQLKRLNKTSLPVKVYKSDVYYKYTVGSFKDFQEAKNFKNAYGLSGYITEYENGKEVKLYLRDVIQ
ncbi:MAG: SPOR domain-containing protein [Chlorobi bacterium]|nr:SPOR domain-containing protein [Chlorobiota bacterium]